jgi:hypothetical protein
MNAAGVWARAGAAGLLVMSLAGCGVVPVPGLLKPVFGPRRSYTTTTLCVVDRSGSRGLRTVEVQKEEGTGRLFIREKGKRRLLPVSKEGGYAAKEAWFQGGAAIRQYSRRYVKYGPRRTVQAAALTRGADHEGIPVFLDRNDTQRPRALYIPVQPGCVFQPYVDERFATGAGR